MSKIQRAYQYIFGSSLTPTGNVAQFGSAVGTPAYSADPEVLQASDAYGSGFKHASLKSGNRYRSPFLQDLNGLFYLITYHLKYFFQQGIPEWNAATTYGLYAFAQAGGKVYMSLQANNLNHAVSEVAWWAECLSGFASKVALRYKFTTPEVIRAVSGTVVAASGTSEAICISATSPAGVAMAFRPAYVSRSSDCWGTSTGGNILTTLRAISWSPERRAFMAVGDDTSYNIADDGMNFPSQEMDYIGSGLWRCVCWSPELGVWCAGRGDQNQMAVSAAGGTTWSFSNTNAAAGNISICWSPELGIFVSPVAGSTNVITSPNGINWTIRTAPEASGWSGICWSPELRLFVAVATSGTYRVMTSSDGVTWTPRTTGVEANQWRSVAWSPGLRVFFAVASSGTNRGMYSFDGVTWTPVDIGPRSWNCVVWDDYYGRFVMSAGTYEAGQAHIKTTRYIGRTFT